MRNYRILQDNLGFHVQIDKGRHHLSYPGAGVIYLADWQTLETYKTLKEARASKDKLEIAAGRIVK